MTNPETAEGQTDSIPAILPLHDLVTLGGGAAGFFGSITFAERGAGKRITILERGGEVLEKVRISGGGRCNVTNGITDPKELAKHYPRGEKELLGPFHKFHCEHTREWFSWHGVETHEEQDGRVFPITNDSMTIVQCLKETAKENGITVRTHCRVTQLVPPQGTRAWLLQVNDEEWLEARQVLFTTGSIPSSWKLLERIGHNIVPPVPSLFTFNIKDGRIKGLEGISVPWAKLTAEGMTTEGPLLITHWGLSGPAALRLSAWGARKLSEVDYRFELTVNWTGWDAPQVEELLRQCRADHARKLVTGHTQCGLSARLWQRMCEAAQITETQRWADLRKDQLLALQVEMCGGVYRVNGKSTFKEEFVTAGGVALSEVDFRHFRSRKFPTLYFAGEVLDIDAVTGGFNFQAAWTGSYLAGMAMEI